MIRHRDVYMCQLHHEELIRDAEQYRQARDLLQREPGLLERMLRRLTGR